MLTLTGTIRRVWGGPAVGYTVIVEPLVGIDRLVLRTRDTWMAALAERYLVFTGRPTVTVQYDPQTLELQGVGLPVAS
jgi:hypothetical protein